MSLRTDVKKEIKVAQKVWFPWWAVLLWMAFCLPVVWYFDHIGRLTAALPALNFLAVLGFLIALKWRLRRRVWFWIVISILAVLHGLFVWYVPWTTKWVPAIAMGLVDSVDFCIALWVLAFIGRLAEGPGARE